MLISSRYQSNRLNFVMPMLDDVIELQQADALEIVPNLAGGFDFVFIDAGKRDYIRYFPMVDPKLRPGRAILAHNELGYRSGTQNFLEAAENNPDRDTHIERQSHAGISVRGKQRRVAHVDFAGGGA